MSADRPLAGAIDAAVAGPLRQLRATNEARERALPLCREAIRHAANCIRAVHRSEPAEAQALLDRSRQAVHAAAEALRDHTAVLHAGFVHDAQKEFTEAAATLALVFGHPLPAPEELRVEGPAYLHGLAETVGELRRHLLDSLRHDDLSRCERLLGDMDDIYSMLTTVDYPDAITANLRRATDVARAILERTRGDLTLATQQYRLASRLERLESCED